MNDRFNIASYLYTLIDYDEEACVTLRGLYFIFRKNKYYNCTMFHLHKNSVSVR